MVLDARLRQYILDNLPRDMEITRVEFEGPRISIYTKNPEIISDQSYAIADIVRLIKKRIVIRSDPAVRMDPAEAREVIEKLIPKESGVESISFDSAFGEVVIQARKVGLVIGKSGQLLHEIIKRTKWKPSVLREPPLPSKTIRSVREYLCEKADRRSEILRLIGERVFRPLIYDIANVNVTGLGGCGEVGRSAMLVRTPESSILLDCGVNLGSRKTIEAFPRFDEEEFDPTMLDAVIVTHAHLDHCGFLPFLFKYGYRGPVYCSTPTASLMTLLQLDYLDVLRKEGLPQPYGEGDVRKTLLHTITVDFGEVNDIAPDVRFTLHNAGHILGSSIVHLHVGEGLYNIVYTGDFKSSRTKLLESATTSFPRIETLMIESTYGSSTDLLPHRAEAERAFVERINQTIANNGKVLVPVPAVGRAQEVMLILDKCIKEGSLVEVPVFIEGMVAEATAIHTAYPGWLSRSLRDQILVQGESPFESECFTVIRHSTDREGVIYGGPCVIIATSGMLEGGPAIDYFRQLASGEENALVFVSYQIEGTLGSRIERGLKEVSVVDDEGKMRVVKVNCDTMSIRAFSGHSDRREIVGYVGRLTPRPKRVIVCHGERTKTIDLARALHRIYGVSTTAPLNLETLRLR